jgi:hypothetical protein
VSSRLLSPRRLEPLARYSAFLVPAFDLGVRAGLGEDVAGETAAAPAWPAGGQAMDLPYYHRFDFRSGEQGDFETLARALTPRELPAEVGIRPMYVDRPGWDLPSAGAPLGMGGALRSLETEDTDWSGPERDTFVAALADELNRAEAPPDDPDDDPVVVPPLYGRWHAERTRLDARGTGWFDELNRDPRRRAAAGMGTRVVTAQRSAILHAAWLQVDGILAANERVRQMKLGQAVSERLHARRLGAAPEGVLLTLTAPLHSRVRAAERTVRGVVDDSRLPAASVDAAFRRIARPLGGVRRRQLGDGAVEELAAAPVVERLASGDLAAAPLVPRAPATLVSLDDILRAHAPPAPVVGGGGVIAAIRDAVGAGTRPTRRGGLLGPVLTAIGVRGEGGPRAPGEALLDARAVRAAPSRPGFAVVPPGAAQPGANVGGPGGLRPRQPDSPDAAAFRGAIALVAERLQRPAAPVEPAPVAPVAALAGQVLDLTDPTTTVPARLRATIRLEPQLAHVTWDPERPDEIMAAPEFPQPMYEPLRDLSQDHLLPNLADVAQDTVALVLEDHAFIEAYHAALNHETMRRLLLAGYPTDQRGSPFRQFWDVSGYVARAGDPTDSDALRDRLNDVPPLHDWPTAAPLGTNRNRPDADGLVLLVRGRLLRRYPGAIVYACRAAWDPVARRRVILEPEEHVQPQYRGTLDPDLTFFGFALTAERVRGDEANPARDPGWFFVFQQQPSEPRFGFEPLPDPPVAPPVEEWNDLTWANLAPAGTDPGELGFAPATGALANVAIRDLPAPGGGVANPGDRANAWGADAAQTAFIAMRRPARVAIHGRTMVPEERG